MDLRTTDRLIEISQQFAARKRWTDNWPYLSYAAVGLVTAEGSPRELVAQTLATVDELKTRLSRFSSVRGYLRVCIASGLVVRGISAAKYIEAVASLRAHFRSAGLRRNGLSEALATLILIDSRGSELPSSPQVQRTIDIYAALRERHGFLTNALEYTSAALLSKGGGPAQSISDQLERLQGALRERGFRGGASLRLASQILHHAPAQHDPLTHRFHALFEVFKGKGLRMNRDDYDEIAFLSYLDEAPEAVASTHLAIRDALREGMMPRPSKQLSFTLAAALTSTAFAPVRAAKRGDLQAMALVLEPLTLIQAHRAAVTEAAG